MVCGREVSGNAEAPRGALSQDSQPAGKLETASAFCPVPPGFQASAGAGGKDFLRAVVRKKGASAPWCERLKLEAHSSPAPTPLNGFRFRAGIPAAPRAG